MTLRQQVKQTKTRTSQVHAVVESTAIGRATVVLVGSAQRMTNLPVYGKEVSVGDEVIIDYSSQGIPFCRAPVQYEEDEPLETRVIANESIVDGKDGFVAVKVGLLSNRYFTETVAGDTFTWTPVLFDDILYDNRSLWRYANGWCGEMPTGQYVVTASLGFEHYGGAGYIAVQVLNFKASTNTLTPVDFRTPYSDDVGSYSGTSVINFTTLARISDPDEAIGLGFYASGTNPQILAAYSMFSIHKLKNLSPDNSLAIRGYWDTGGTYF